MIARGILLLHGVQMHGLKTTGNHGESADSWGRILHGIHGEVSTQDLLFMVVKYYMEIMAKVPTQDLLFMGVETQFKNRFSLARK